MKSIIYYITILILSTQFSYSQTIIVKLNPLDCMNCNFLLPKIVNMYPNTKIVLEKVYEKQYKNIEKSLGPKDYTPYLIYSDSIYQSLNKNKFSEVVVLSNTGEILSTQDLKKVDFEMINISEPKKILCDDNIQDFTTISSLNNYWIIRNLITNELSYSYNMSVSKNINLNIDDINSIIFKVILKDTMGLRLLQNFKEYPNVKSSLTSFHPLNEKEWYGLIETTHITIQNNHDTMFRNKVFLIHSLNEKIEVYKLENPSGTYLFQYSLYYWKNKLYVRTFKSEYNINNLPNILGEIEIEKLKNNTAKIQPIDNYVLDQDLIKFGINYSLPSIIASHQFVMYPLSNKIYNLDTRKTIEIPHINQYLAENKIFKEEDRLSFLTYDMKYRKNDETICLLYEFNENLYYSIFKIDGKIIIKHQQILPNKYWDSTKVIFLSEDGNYLYYIPSNESCIKSLKISNS